MRPFTAAMLLLNIAAPIPALAQEPMPTFRTISLGVELAEFRKFNRYPLAHGQRWLCSDDKTYAKSLGQTPTEEQRKKYGTVVCTVVRQSAFGYPVQDRVPIPGLLTPATIELTFFRTGDGLPRLLGELELVTSPDEADEAKRLFSARYGQPKTDLEEFPFPRHVWNSARAEIRIVQYRFNPKKLFITYETEKFQQIRIKDYLEQQRRNAREL